MKRKVAHAETPPPLSLAPSPLRVSVLALTLLLVPALHASEIESGKRLADGCFGCHGEAGISSSHIYPHLAGQQRNYLLSQLYLFKSSKRQDGDMLAVTRTLSGNDLRALATYYQSLPAVQKQPSKPPPRVAANCLSCHETTRAAPTLTGQPAAYLAKQLRDYQSGRRQNGTMQPVATALSNKQIETLATWFAGR